MDSHKQVEIEAISLIIKDFNKAISLLDKRNYTKALTLFNRILKQQQFRELYLNMGVAYKGLNNFDKIKFYFEKACDHKIPFSDGTYKADWAPALSNLGLYHYMIEEDDIAEVMHRKALTADPLYYDAIWNLSLVCLRKYCSNKSEELIKSWEYYTYRFKRSKAEPLKNRKLDIKLWDFKTKYDASVCILLEQGMGDAMMFSRYIPYLEKYFNKVYVQCTEEMNVFFENPCRDAIDTDAEYAVPMCSLGKILDYIPEGDTHTHLYHPRVRADKLEIMCIWGGNEAHTNSANRKVSAGYFDKLSKYGNLHSVVKRKGYSYMPITDWKDTIKYLEQIDIVVTIDSSVAHLCGCLGKPCLVLMPLLDTDFRWGDSSMGYNNKWYNSVKVIRNPNNWENVFQNVQEILQKL